VAMLEAVKESGKKGMVHYPGSSQLGVMLTKIGQKEGYNVLNIVRSEEKKKKL